MKVIHLSVECYPVAKVGGLADVVGALPKYLNSLGVDTSLVMPYYHRKFTQEHDFEVVAKGEIYQGSILLEYEVLKEINDVLGFPLYMIRIPGLLDREEVYCYADEADQWIAFQHAFLHYLKHQSIHPDIVHCHDHHVGLIPFLLQYSSDYKELSTIRSVFTVHNGQYQGWMNWSKGIILPAFDTWKWGLLDWDGLINPLAAAIKCCNAYTTVSEGYLQELFKQANGLEHLFYDERGKGFGIVNGIDTAIWDPETDSLIPFHYDEKTVAKGKKENRALFCKDFYLDPEKPLLSYIGRFATEKGADILADIVDQAMQQYPDKISIFILGSGDNQVQDRLAILKDKYQQDFAVYFGYNEQLAHRVYAASDLLIMPSRVEPCGLNQLYALKYGTIPIVRSIGGLKDTVLDVDQGGYGFIFEDVEPEQAVNAIGRALDYLFEENKLEATRKDAMELDFSWDKSASKYKDLYYQLLK